MGTYKKLRTPIIKPRTQGGTFYTFSSAMEDIGLNINELKNKVTLSHYVLLNIPAFDAENYGDSKNSGDYTFAQHFQNYALNMETVMRNQPTYNFAESLSVSERVFWKYMQKYGGMSFVTDEKTGYYVDDSSCVTAFGQISAGAQRTDEYGIYNETFVQIPSSHGKMKVLFKPVPDKNYYDGGNYYSESTTGNIENCDDSLTNGILPTGITGQAEYDSDKCYTINGEKDELCVVLSIADIRNYYDDQTLTYDDLAMQGYGLKEDESGAYSFNAILLYYSIYDSTTKNVLATNAYGLMVLESAVTGVDGKYKFPAIEKRKTTSEQTGNSYSFRLNIKTSSVYSGDITVNDNSTAAFAMSTDFNDVIRNLSAAVETLKSNANVIAKISTDNTAVKQLALQCMDKVEDIERDIQQIKSGKTRKISADSVIASTASFDTLDASTILYDASGNTVGAFDSDVFKYKSAEFDSADIDEIKGKLVTNVISADDSNKISVKDSIGNTYAYVDSSGLYYANNSDTLNTIESEMVDAFFDAVNVTYSDDFGFSMSKNSDSDSAPLLSVFGENSDSVNLQGIIAMIIAKLKELG